MVFMLFSLDLIISILNLKVFEEEHLVWVELSGNAMIKPKLKVYLSLYLNC